MGAIVTFLNGGSLVRFLEGFLLAFVSGTVIDLTSHGTIDPNTPDGRATIAASILTGFLLAVRRYFAVKDSGTPTNTNGGAG